MMPMRRKDSARAGPTPLRKLIGVSRNSRGCFVIPSEARNPYVQCSSLAALGMTSGQQLGGERRRVEADQVVRLLADAQEFHGNVDRLVHGHDDATARGAVQLRDH